MKTLEDQIRAVQKEAMGERLRYMRRQAQGGKFAKRAEDAVDAMNENGYAISIDSYRALERGRMPNHLELLKICQFFDTDPNCWLFGFCESDADMDPPQSDFIDTITEGCDENFKNYVKDVAKTVADKAKEYHLHQK